MKKSFLGYVLVMFFVLNVSLFAGAAKAITNGSPDWDSGLYPIYYRLNCNAGFS